MSSTCPLPICNSIVLSLDPMAHKQHYDSFFAFSTTGINRILIPNFFFHNTQCFCHMHLIDFITSKNMRFELE